MSEQGKQVLFRCFENFSDKLVGPENPQGYNPNDIERIFLQRVAEATETMTTQIAHAINEIR